jgi:hypothetical protein
VRGKKVITNFLGVLRANVNSHVANTEFSAVFPKTHAFAKLLNNLSAIRQSEKNCNIHEKHVVYAHGVNWYTP